MAVDNTNGFAEFSRMRSAQNKGLGFWGWMAIVLCVYIIFMPAKKQDVTDTQIAQVEKVDMSSVPRQTISSDKIAATIQGFRISGINLDDYKEKKGEMDNVELLSGDDEFVEIGMTIDGKPSMQPKAVTEKVGKDGVLTMSWSPVPGVFVRRRFVPQAYTISIFDEIRNGKNKEISVSQNVRLVRNMGEKNRVAVKTGGISNVGGSIKRDTFESIGKNSVTYSADKESFIGFSDQYWEVIAAPYGLKKNTINMAQRSDKMFVADAVTEPIKILADHTVTINSAVFAGPKTQKVLLDASKIIPGIDRTIDYGWFVFLTRPFLWTLNQLHNLIPNYGIAIILLTLLIRGFMWPLSKKSYESAAKMQKIQPEVRMIQQRYASDKTRLQQEMMMLYKRHKVNPFSSLGVMILQIPIFFALYKTLLIAVPLRQAEFLWLSDLSVMDPYFILPILMAVTMRMQNRINRKSGVDVGAKFMKYMPIIFAVLFAWMPSGLVLYWTVSNLVGVLQMKIMQKDKK